MKRRLATWWSALRAQPPADVTGVILAVAAIAIAFVASTWGLFGPVPEGHYASDGAVGVAADNMWRGHTLLPVVGYLPQFPGSGSSYMHHPLGMFWIVALLGKLFGFRDFVVRLPVVFYVTGTTFFLYRIGRELWGKLPAGIGALAFVSLPITLGFANFNDLEQPVMFGCVVSTWGYIRYVRTWRERYAIASVLGFGFALINDWQAYIWGAFMLAGLFVRGYLVPERLFGPLLPRRFGRYWGLMCWTALFCLGVTIALIQDSGRLADVLLSYATRSGGSGVPLAQVLVSRHYRIGLMFTGLAIVLGKIAVPVIVARTVRTRNDLELLSLPLLFGALVQYVFFKQGADVHIFWPHPFATYFGLAMGALAASVRDIAAWLGRRLGPSAADRVARAAPWIALALVGLPVLLVLKDGLGLFRLARETGGRFAEANLESDLDKDAALRWFLPRVPATAGVGFHASVHAYWDKQWQLRPRVVSGAQPVVLPASPRVYLMDTRSSPTADLQAAAARFHVHAAGWNWLVDRSEKPGPIDGYAVDERNPSFVESWAFGSTEPRRQFRFDPWVTWEWRTLFQQPAQAPAGTPVTTDQLRIAHNAALARNDAAAAARFRAALRGRFNLPLGARYDGGTELIGAIRDRGAQRSITLYFVAGTFKADARFGVHAKVLSPARFSTLPADPTDLETQGGPTWPTTLWRPGHIYSIKIVYRRRPGEERFTGAWVGGPKRIDAPGPVELARF